MKTYLITGGAGFIGSNFVIYMLKKYQDIKIIMLDKLTYAADLNNLGESLKDERLLFIEGDICDYDLVNNIFEKNNIDYVINFAAESHVDRSIASAKEFERTNVGGTVNLLNVANQHWGIDMENHKFVQISTDEVYGSLGLQDPLFTENTAIAPRSPYSASKASADFFVKSFHSTHGMPVNITRCSNNYGKHQHLEKLIPTIISKMLNGEAVPIYGDGMQIRDWLYVLDHCSAIDLVTHNGRNGEIYNVGGNNEIKNIDMVNIIGEELKQRKIISEYHITHVADRKGHDRRYGICSDKLQKELGWNPDTEFSVGIKETLDWYLEKMKG